MKIGTAAALLIFMLAGSAGNSLYASEAATGVDFEPPPDDYDWVQLTSDEWLKGELIALYDDELTFDSDSLGVLSLDWEDVRRFRGGRSHRISVQGHDSIAGRRNHPGKG